ncbi:G-protein-signaling modulator 2 [Chamberlinius hualienensis]
MLAKMDNNMCMELALEGERLCKSGDCKAGVTFFEAALQAGTNDAKTASAIYSQLGNAYFYLRDYVKALEYHKNDLALARSIGDRPGEAKASGNLGNTLKVLGKYDEAIICCRRHLDISHELNDKVGEGRALYNLGNVYHAKGKNIGRLGHKDPGEFPAEVKTCLEKAVEYYKGNLKLMIELQDLSAQGRACGNLGNTYYLLGNFKEAIVYHEERLKIACSFGDKAAERRAHSNLGNAHIFLGEFETAAEHYRYTLRLAQELNDRAVEAQACYSLGNTHTLLRDYPTAIEYHLRHLSIAQELMDKIGEARACWSLGNAHSAIGNHEKALTYAHQHLQLSKEIGDKTGQATAQMNLSDLRKVLGLQHSSDPLTEAEPSNNIESTPSTCKKNKARRTSMENLDLFSLTPEAKANKTKSYTNSGDSEASGEKFENKPLTQSVSLPTSVKMDSVQKIVSNTPVDDDIFFELLCRFQGNRMDDQRCSLNTMAENKENQRSISNSTASISSSSGSTSRSSNRDTQSSSSTSSSNDSSLRVKEELLDLIAGMQSKRLDEQRASLPGLNNNPPGPPSFLQRLSTDSSLPDDSFFDMLMRCQGSRLEDQRSSFPSEERKAPTVPDEDFFRLIMRVQSGRIEDQRSNIPSLRNTPISKSSSSGRVASSSKTTSGKSKSSSLKSNRSHKSKRDK